MTTEGRTFRLRLLALLAVLALAVAACGGGDGDAEDDATDSADTAAAGDDAADDAAGDDDAATDDGGDGEPVEIEWWHIQNADPGMSDWQAMADQYMEDNPNVTITINVMENEAFKAAIQTNLQAGDIPDIFQSWGGGVLRQQVEAGAVRDISDLTADWIGDLNPAAVELHQIDGAQYGVPYNAGVVGIWYNQDLFEEAGLDAPADTWEGLLEQVQTLKDAGITPIAVGAGDKWPAHFWYSYLMIRAGGGEAMEEIAETQDFTADHVITAGELVGELVALEPFQEGFLGAPWDAPDGEAGVMAQEGAAMDLMGQWAPGTFRSQLGVTPEEGLPWNIGWAPFPSVEGGAGSATEALGGVDGFAVGADAPDEAVDFLRFITNTENQEIWAQNTGLPVNPEAFDAVEDEAMQDVLAGLQEATFMQLFLDQFFSPEVGAEINDQTALLFAGEVTPEEAAEAITAVAGG